MRGGYHLALAKLSHETCAKACLAVTGLVYEGREIRDSDLVGRDSRKHNAIPRSVVWKILRDDGVPIDRIAAYFDRSRTGIQSGIVRLNEARRFNTAADRLYQQALNGYHS